MHYYAIKPFFIPDGHSIDLSLGEEAVSNILESAYWNLQSDARVYDHIYRANHDDLLVFDSLNEFEKAAGVLKTFEIQFETHVVEKTEKNQADFSTDNQYYKVVVPNQPEYEGANVNEPRHYTVE